MSVKLMRDVARESIDVEEERDLIESLVTTELNLNEPLILGPPLVVEWSTRFILERPVLSFFARCKSSHRAAV